MAERRRFVNAETPQCHATPIVSLIYDHLDAETTLILSHNTLYVVANLLGDQIRRSWLAESKRPS